MMLKISVFVCLTALFLINNAHCNQKRIRRENQTQLLVDGVDINNISDEDLNGLFNAEDEKLTGELDIWIGKQTLREKQRLRRIPPVIVAVGTRVVWTAGRHIMKTLIRNTLPKTSKDLRLRQYFKRGGYKSAQGDFWRFKPMNIKRFTGKDGQEGITGKILDGKYTLTVRRTSSYSRIKNGGKVFRQGRPTLELRSNTGGKLVRKVRYEDRWSYRHKNTITNTKIQSCQVG
ncbi:uncharacterized protein LOC134246153 [Saccostrea cucullata]|uniref:uncharacterized protein LOC134246153 n=1 Tax=Saccostrea cuccullata TaxID=36930 RepID=UPI002ED1F56F